MAQPWTTIAFAATQHQPKVDRTRILAPCRVETEGGSCRKGTIGLGNPNKIPGLVLDNQGSVIPHLPGEGC